MMTSAGIYLLVRVRSAQSAWSKTFGSSQGDSLSSVLLAPCFFAVALVAVRQKTTKPDPLIAIKLEWEYADDVDFADEE